MREARCSIENFEDFNELHYSTSHQLSQKKHDVNDMPESSTSFLTSGTMREKQLVEDALVDHPRVANGLPNKGSKYFTKAFRNR